jgi:GTP-binding GTPase N-terminal
MTTIPTYQIIKTFTQKYLNRSKYGIGSEEIKQFVRESKSEKIIIDEHLTSKQIHNLEKLTSVPVIDRERLSSTRSIDDLLSFRELTSCHLSRTVCSDGYKVMFISFRMVIRTMNTQN